MNNGCETWSLTLSDHVKVRVFNEDNKLLGTIYGDIQCGDSGEFKKIHNDELHARSSRKHEYR